MMMGDVGGRTEGKTNTWPCKLAESSDDPDLQQQLSDIYGSGFDPFRSDPEYTHYLASLTKMKQGGFLPPQGPWSAGDGGVMGGWPHPSLYGPQDSRESVGLSRSSQWTSTTGDSSSCSDDDSNGDAPWGTTQAQGRSSSEEVLPADSGGRGGHTDRRTATPDKDPKGTKTWPPKQLWGKPDPPPPPGSASQQPAHMSHGQPLANQVHPALSMQWSDPLTNRSLSAWAPVLAPGSMAGYGSLSATQSSEFH